LHAIGACDAAFGQIQQSTLLKRGNNPDFLRLENIRRDIWQLLCHGLVTARRRFGNPFTLQKIIVLYRPNCGGEGAGAGGDIQRLWRHIAVRRDM